MTVPTPPTDALAGTSTAFAARYLREGDAGYDDARRVHNGFVDKRPAIIARCTNTSQVVDAIALARSQNLEIAVRGGGHNVSGRATCDRGMMIDLSPMKGISIDPGARTARVEPGVTWGELNGATQAHGLATTGGVISSTGVAGLTLGGGIGWIMGKYGLAVDNLLAVEIVLADGRVVTASEQSHPDLFWAVRGGGGNFGVVTSFQFRLHPVGPTIAGGLAAHPVANAREVLRFFRERTRTAPDELTMFAGLVHAPDGSNVPLSAILACHCGSLEEGLAAIQPIKDFGPPVMDAMGPIEYSQMNSMLDAGYPRGARNYWKSSFLDELTDDAIETMARCYETCPSPMAQLLLEHVHGAVSRVPADATAFPHRRDGYNFLVLTQWMDPADDARCIQWTRDTYAAMKPFTTDGRYMNYLDADDATGSAAAYGVNYGRLQQLKRKYDPENVFHLNPNIRPVE
ncbi:MAG TPA: FAD-binding oxidoreductase [Gemmatimonadaceae bacterium]|nr:FAD-binding oxidoreductase [Gemmatimonadaceae bacterium]